MKGLLAIWADIDEDTDNLIKHKLSLILPFFKGCL